MRVLIVGLALALMPLTAFAQSCGHEKRANMGCAEEGQVWDEATQSCIVETS